MRRVLVLNQDYSPLSVCTAERAFLLIFLNKAELVHDDKKRHMRTVDRRYPMPSVIRLQKYIFIPFKGVILSRQNIFKRDGQECLYCGSKKTLRSTMYCPSRVVESQLGITLQLHVRSVIRSKEIRPQRRLR